MKRSDPTPLSDPTAPPPATSWLLVALCWAVVAVPAGWGVYRTALNAAPLFRGARPTTAATR